MLFISRSRDRLRAWSDLVILAHIVFTLPFTVVGIYLAATLVPVTLLKVALLCIAQTSAYVIGMLVNRLSDYDIDTLNPRTRARGLVARTVSSREVVYLLIANLLIFLIACLALNPLCLVLSPLALFMVTVYNFTKRFTWLCHIWLGVTCALGPAGAWAGLTASVISPVWIVGLGCALWIAGFDIIYALNDLEFDREHGLYSIPARFGREKALTIARLFHLGAVLSLFSLPLFYSFNYFYWTGCGVMALELAGQHIVSQKRNFGMKLFTYSNTVIALTYFTFTTLGLYWP
ncbi:MAG: putative 4-hydroxybenzoate polyprenyltransferase [Desulfarculales bacterium]|jgi:4-hydroxybenzoate polyprenyltransferase|nr:putative 4-hydroxybenzoate polyprenyltransferase [Desulfarculales bacterium]